MNTMERIEEKLSVLNPDSVELIDDSEKHAGHEGAKGGGGHFQLIIVSPVFEGKSTQARHRLVHAALGGMFQREIHAIAIKAYTPDEI
jgi:BolA protein